MEAKHSVRIEHLTAAIVAVEAEEGKKAASNCPAWLDRKQRKEELAEARKGGTEAKKQLSLLKKELEQAENHFRQLLLRACGTSWLHEELDAELTLMVLELDQASSEQSRLTARASEIRDFLRFIIEAAPTGHTSAATKDGRLYKAWLNLAGKVGAYLQWSPAYTYWVLQLARRFGWETLAPFLAVSKTELEQACAADKLQDLEGNPVSLEQLQAEFLQFDPDAYSPKVQPIISGQPLTDTVSNFRAGDTRLLEESDLDPRHVELIKQHTAATTVEDVKRMPAVQLAAIKGIGLVGYGEILARISGKVHLP